MEALPQNLWVAGSCWGSAPDPGIFRGMAPVFQGLGRKPRCGWATGQVPWTHRRLGYPLPGCVPAEPDSV